MMATVKASHIKMRSCFLYIHSLLLIAHYITLFHCFEGKAVTLNQHLYGESMKSYVFSFIASYSL